MDLSLADIKFNTQVNLTDLLFTIEIQLKFTKYHSVMCDVIVTETFCAFFISKTQRLRSTSISFRTL